VRQAPRRSPNSSAVEAASIAKLHVSRGIARPTLRTRKHDRLLEVAARGIAAIRDATVRDFAAKISRRAITPPLREIDATSSATLKRASQSGLQPVRAARTGCPTSDTSRWVRLPGKSAEEATRRTAVRCPPLARSPVIARVMHGRPTTATAGIEPGPGALALVARRASVSANAELLVERLGPPRQTQSQADASLRRDRGQAPQRRSRHSAISRSERGHAGSSSKVRVSSRRPD
jgi:hypothetical protein